MKGKMFEEKCRDRIVRVSVQRIDDTRKRMPPTDFIQQKFFAMFRVAL